MIGTLRKSPPIGVTTLSNPDSSSGNGGFDTCHEDQRWEYWRCRSNPSCPIMALASG